MMGEGFHDGFNITNFLFEDLNITSAGGLAALCVVLAVSACILEAFKLLRAYLYCKSHQSPFSQRGPVNEGTPLVQPLSLPPSLDHIKKRRLYLHIGQSGVHLAEVTLAYLLMLAVMSYNVWVFLSVTAASSLGYFLFGSVRHNLVNAHKIRTIEPESANAPPEETVEINR